MTSEEKCWGKQDTAIFTMPYLILLTLSSHKVFKLIFLKQSFWPKIIYAEQWWKLAWAIFLGNVPIFLVQQFCRSLMKSCLIEYVTVFLIKNKFQRVILNFYIGLVPPFYFLKWNRFFSTFIPVLSESCHYFNYLLPRKVCTNFQIKRFPLMKFWYITWMYRGIDFQSNNIKKHLSPPLKTTKYSQ